MSPTLIILAATAALCVVSYMLGRDDSGGDYREPPLHTDFDEFPDARTSHEVNNG